jgi:tRNA pseudouridine55 synthase
MGRRRGRPVTGWIILDKPAGPGSTDLVNRVRRLFGAAKAGHTGTLDPAATGVLAIALGEATKCIALIEDGPKIYRFRVVFGAATATDDAEGEVIARSDLRPDAAAIEAALVRFRGDIRQVPPQVSAVKVDGARAHALVRAGGTVALEERNLHVARLVLTGHFPPDEAEFEMTCGRGGYVRAIARDLGQDLGGHAHVKWLRRLSTGPFTLAEATDQTELEALAEAGRLETALRPLEWALKALPVAEVDAGAALRLGHGNAAATLTAMPDGTLAWARGPDGRAVAAGRVTGGVLQPSRVFNRDTAE